MSQQRPKERDRLGPQGAQSFLAPLAEETNARWSLETNIAGAYVESLLNTRPGVVEEVEQYVIAMSLWAVGLDGADDKLDIAWLEMGGGARHGSLFRDMQDGSALGNGERFVAGHEGIEATQGRQAAVASADADVPIPLEVLQERKHFWR
jgi:hypothetical protein